MTTYSYVAAPKLATVREYSGDVSAHEYHLQQTIAIAVSGWPHIYHVFCCWQLPLSHHEKRVFPSPFLFLSPALLSVYQINHGHQIYHPCGRILHHLGQRQR